MTVMLARKRTRLPNAPLLAIAKLLNRHKTWRLSQASTFESLRIVGPGTLDVLTVMLASHYYSFLLRNVASSCVNHDAPMLGE